MQNPSVTLCAIERNCCAVFVKNIDIYLRLPSNTYLREYLPCLPFSCAVVMSLAHFPAKEHFFGIRGKIAILGTGSDPREVSASHGLDQAVIELTLRCVRDSDLNISTVFQEINGEPQEL